LVGVGAEPIQFLVWMGGDPHVWEGPRIQWADWQDPGAMLFILHDVTEEKE
jgi:hypothetical protein